MDKWVTDYDPPCSIPLNERYALAMAYMEQYGIYVGNFLLGSVQSAMKERDFQRAADMMAIGRCVDELNGGSTEVQRNPPIGKGFAH